MFFFTNLNNILLQEYFQVTAAKPLAHYKTGTPEHGTSDIGTPVEQWYPRIGTPAVQRNTPEHQQNAPK